MPRSPSVAASKAADPVAATPNALPARAFSFWASIASSKPLASNATWRCWAMSSMKSRGTP